MTEIIGWCPEHGKEPVVEVYLGRWGPRNSGFRLKFKCGKNIPYKLPFMIQQGGPAEKKR